jgi:hypothetical protein
MALPQLSPHAHLDGGGRVGAARRREDLLVGGAVKGQMRSNGDMAAFDRICSITRRC